MNCVEYSYVGGIPSIRYRVVPDALHPTAESTAVTVAWKDPTGVEIGSISSPDAQLIHTTAIEDVDGVATLISYWVFTFPAVLTVGSKRHPYKVKFDSTAGIIAELMIERIVLPSGY